MSIYFPPTPPVFTGGKGRQPYSGFGGIIPVSVDNPPFVYGGPVALKAETVSINQPNPWVYTYFGALQPFAPKKLNPSITAVQVDNPPFTYGGPFAEKLEIVSINQPDPWTYKFFGAWQPFAPRKLTPGIPGQSVDNPPFTNPGRTANLAEIISLLQPDPWVYKFQGGLQPYSSRKLSPSNEPLPVFSGYYKVYIIF